MTQENAPLDPPKKKPKNDKPNSLRFWGLLIGGILLVLVLNYVRERTVANDVSFSEFKQAIESGKSDKFDTSNVHELQVGSYFITFQNKPANLDPKQQSTEEELARKRYRVPIGDIPDASLDRLLTLLESKGVAIKGSSPPTDFYTVFSVMLLASLVLMFIVFLKRIGGGSAAMSFGRSRGKLMADDDVKTTFDDVAGINEAVEELREVVEFLRTPGKYQALGGRIPRGVLLVGPPGTGKTLLAKAVAGEAGVPFFSLSGSDFVEMFVGVGAARVRDMFAQAAQKAPAIIFIDELDALGKVRGSGLPGGHDEREQTLNALLVEMDGFSSDESVIIMGATNRPETLDPALMRPGRFDRHVLVDRPDYKGREAILNVHSKKIKMDDDVNLQRLAKLTPGFVGADLANLVNEAALLAARKNKQSVSMSEFEEGIERVIAGLEKSTRIIHEDEKLRVAYHESGHALVATCLPQADPVHKISIIPRGFGALGYMLQRPEDDRYLVTQTELENRICVALGGIAAEEAIFEETSTGASNDLEQATEIARRMVMEFGMSAKLGRVNYRESKRSPFLRGSVQGGGETIHAEQTMREIDLEVRRVVDENMELARDILRTRRDTLERITQELIERETMSSEELQKILDESKTGPQLKPGTSVSRQSNTSENTETGSQDLGRAEDG